MIADLYQHTTRNFPKAEASAERQGLEAQIKTYQRALKDADLRFAKVLRKAIKVAHYDLLDLHP